MDISPVWSAREGGVIIALTFKYGAVRTGERFKIGQHALLVAPRKLSETQFIAVEDRLPCSTKRHIKVICCRLPKDQR